MSPDPLGFSVNTKFYYNRLCSWVMRVPRSCSYVKELQTHTKSHLYNISEMYILLDKVPVRPHAAGLAVL